MHPLVQLAKKSIEEFVKRGSIIPEPEILSGEMKEKAGVFVSIKKNGQLRGCIGTFMPCQQNVAAEVIRNAISAATQDPRFARVGEDELAKLEFSVDVLSTPEKIRDESQLDPKRFGVIVVSEHKRGLLLPDLEGVDSIDEQLRIAKMKAGIQDDDKCEILRFEVHRYR